MMPRLPRRGGPPGQPHMQFVTHVELNDLIQPIADLAQQAIDESGSKDNRMDILQNIVNGVQSTQASNINRITRLEQLVGDLVNRVQILESLVADQQEQIDALALLFS